MKFREIRDTIMILIMVEILTQIIHQKIKMIGAKVQKDLMKLEHIPMNLTEVMVDKVVLVKLL